MIRAYAHLIAACGASIEAVWTNASQGNAWVRAGAGPWLAPEEKRALLATEKGSHVFARLEKATGRAQWHSYPLPLPPRRLFC